MQTIAKKATDQCVVKRVVAMAVVWVRPPQRWQVGENSLLVPKYGVERELLKSQQFKNLLPNTNVIVPGVKSLCSLTCIRQH